MKENYVVHSQIKRREYISLPSGRYAEYTIASENASFLPGQYLMVRALKREVCWPLPYLIHGATQEGYKVLASGEQELAQCAPGDRVEYWGPRGISPVETNDALLLVAQQETLYLLHPFTFNGGFEWLVLANGMPLPEVVERIAGRCNTKAIIALNPDTLAALDKASRDAAGLPPNGYIYVSNKKACGFNACKGCYLHSPTQKFGINVCCQGPFMPCSQVDLSLDGNCFEYFSVQEAVK